MSVRDDYTDADAVALGYEILHEIERFGDPYLMGVRARVAAGDGFTQKGQPWRDPRALVRDMPLLAPRKPRFDTCSHGRPDHQAMIRQLAEAMGYDLPAIAATPEQVWAGLLDEVERRFR